MELVGKAYMMGSFQGGLPMYVTTLGLYGFNSCSGFDNETAQRL
ncbi:hypothetical protein V6Z11_D12G095500 [Gossypium hirsutum]